MGWGGVGGCLSAINSCLLWTAFLLYSYYIQSVYSEYVYDPNKFSSPRGVQKSQVSLFYNLIPYFIDCQVSEQLADLNYLRI